MIVQVHFVTLFALLLSILSLQTFPTPHNMESELNPRWIKRNSLNYDCEDVRMRYDKKIISDSFFIASKQKQVDIDQRKYFGIDEKGEPINPNPTYGEAYRCQPSFSLRLGIEVDF